MPRALIRIVVLVLLPGFIVHPSLMATPLTPRQGDSRTLDSIYERQALMLPLGAALFGASNPEAFAAVIRAWHGTSIAIVTAAGIAAFGTLLAGQDEPLSETRVIELYERRLQSHLKRLPYGLWRGPHRLHYAKVLTRYAIEKEGWPIDASLFNHADTRWFKSVKLGGMLSYLFGGNIYDAIANAYPEHAYDPAHPQREHRFHPWDAQRTVWGTDIHFMRQAVRHMIEDHAGWSLSELPAKAKQEWFERVGLGGLFSGHFFRSPYRILRFAYPEAFASGTLAKSHFKTDQPGKSSPRLAGPVILWAILPALPPSFHWIGTAGLLWLAAVILGMDGKRRPNWETTLRQAGYTRQKSAEPRPAELMDMIVACVDSAKGEKRVREIAALIRSDIPDEKLFFVLIDRWPHIFGREPHRASRSAAPPISGPQQEIYLPAPDEGRINRDQGPAKRYFWIVEYLKRADAKGLSAGSRKYPRSNALVNHIAIWALNAQANNEDLRRLGELIASDRSEPDVMQQLPRLLPSGFIALILAVGLTISALLHPIAPGVLAASFFAIAAPSTSIDPLRRTFRRSA